MIIPGSKAVRRLAVWGAVVALVLLNGWFVRLWWQERQLRAEAVEAAKVREQGITTFYRNKLGEEVARARAIALDGRQKDLIRLYTDSLQHHFDIKLKQLESSMKAEVRGRAAATGIPTRDSIIYRVTGHDTLALKTRPFTYTDDFNEITGLIWPSDSVDVAVSYRVPIRAIVYWQRPRLFGFGPRWFTRKRYFGEATSKNPDARVEGLEVVVVKK